MSNIVLIGFMGVGKGSVAREVVKNSSYIAIDTDDLIESMENKKIKCRLVCDKKIYKEQRIASAISFYKNSKYYKFTKSTD